MHFQALVVLLLACGATVTAADPLPGTKPLTLEGDIASTLVDGVDQFLLNKIDASRENRERYWNYNFSSREEFSKSIEPNLKRLRAMLGLRDERVKDVEITSLQDIGTATRPGSKDSYRVEAVRWPVLRDPDPRRSIPSVWGEGVLLTPKSRIVADFVALPDCDQTPLEVIWPGGGNVVKPELQFARRLAERGCRVLVPMLISREMAPRNNRATMSNREYVYRSSFVLGRHPIGYELEQVFSGIDGLRYTGEHPLGIIGYGEGGRLALLAAALDERINFVGLSGSLGPMESMWEEPLDRNVFGFLSEFGAAELLGMIAPRPVVIEHRDGPTLTLSGERGGAPAIVRSLSYESARREIDRVRVPMQFGDGIRWTVREVDGRQPDAETNVVSELLSLIGDPQKPVLDGGADVRFPALDESAMQTRLIEQLDRHNQLVLRESEFVRDEFMKDLKTDSLEAYAKSVEHYLDIFRNDVIGHFDEPLLDANPRSRQTWDSEKWTGYEVVLDVFPDVIAYGALLLPKNIQPGEKRPVVVCQHGLEGRPTDTFLDDHRAYHDYAAKLADEGFVVFAPQNLYLFEHRFRTLQRKANPLGKTLFSVIVSQHQQIVNWLKEQPFVDGDRIAFYGLSYGGKSAMRIPALVTDYCLSICSADFNEWVRKNASTRDNFSYVWTGEYEIFEWNLGNTFNYAEMAALICPRPFMVERGHFDGVGTDPWVAYEYAKVRHLYAAKLKIPERTEIEWFDGPHMINGKRTFEFLHKHLDWPR